MSRVRNLAAAIAVVVGIVGTAAQAESTCSVAVIARSDGSVEFDGSRINDDKKLTALLVQYHKQNPKCAIHISADGTLNFQAVGRVILAAQKAGFLKVGFLTEPRNP